MKNTIKTEDWSRLDDFVMTLDTDQDDDERIKQFISEELKTQREEIIKFVEEKKKRWLIRFEEIDDVAEKAKRIKENDEFSVLINSVLDDLINFLKKQ